MVRDPRRELPAGRRAHRVEIGVSHDARREVVVGEAETVAEFVLQRQTEQLAGDVGSLDSAEKSTPAVVHDLGVPAGSVPDPGLVRNVEEDRHLALGALRHTEDVEAQPRIGDVDGVRRGRQPIVVSAGVGIVIVRHADTEREVGARPTRNVGLESGLGVGDHAHDHANHSNGEYHRDQDGHELPALDELHTRLLLRWHHALLYSAIPPVCVPMPLVFVHCGQQDHLSLPSSSFIPQPLDQVYIRLRLIQGETFFLLVILIPLKTMTE